MKEKLPLGTGSPSAPQRQRLIMGVAVVCFAAALSAVAGQAARADDVNIITSVTDGIDLDTFSGTTAQVAAGITVANTIPILYCATFPAICATTQAWTLTNNGTVGYVYFAAGGSVINYGAVSGSINSIWIQGGTVASVDNKVGATIQGAIVLGENDPVAGSVTNAGTIENADQAIALWDGGTVTNLATGVIHSHGGANAVAVIQGTSRVVNNYGLIQSNDSGFGTGVSLQSGTLTNYLGGQILGAYNGAWTYTGASTINNAGYIEASKAQGGGSAIEVDAGGTIVNSGTIKSFTSNGTTTDAGISFTGAGSITNSGTIMSATGGLAIQFNGSAVHTLTLDTGSILGGNVQGGSGVSDALVLKGIGTESAAKFLSFETLSMQGTEWNLIGTGSFSTSAEVQSGSLHISGTLAAPTVTVGSGGLLDVNGTLTGTTTIASGGTLAGVGTLGATTILAGGFHAPGNSIGTQTINGNYANHGTLQIEVSPTLADKLIINGAVDITGATLALTESPLAGWDPTRDYTIIDNDGVDAVTGTFASVTDNFAFLDPTVITNGGTGNDVVLTILRNSVAFATTALTPNETAAATGAQSLGAGNPVYDAILPLSTTAAPGAFDQLSGEIYATLAGAELTDSCTPREAAFDRVDAAFAALDADKQRPGRNIWTRLVGDIGVINGDGNAAQALTSTGGFMFGADEWLSKTLLLGGEAGVTFGGVSVPDRNSTANIDSVHLGIYGGADLEPLQLSFGAALSGHGTHVTRTPTFAGFTETLDSDSAGLTAQLFGEIGYAFKGDAGTIEPFAGLALVHEDHGVYAETGGAAALSGKAASIDAALVTIGLKASTDFVLPGDVKARAKALLGWQGTLAPTPTATHSFAGGTPFTVSGAALDSHLVLDTDVEFDLPGTTRLDLGYHGALGAGGGHSALLATLSGTF